MAWRRPPLLSALVVAVLAACACGGVEIHSPEATSYELEGVTVHVGWSRGPPACDKPLSTFSSGETHGMPDDVRVSQCKSKHEQQSARPRLPDDHITACVPPVVRPPPQPPSRRMPAADTRLLFPCRILQYGDVDLSKFNEWIQWYSSLGVSSIVVYSLGIPEPTTAMKVRALAKASATGRMFDLMRMDNGSEWPRRAALLNFHKVLALANSVHWVRVDWMTDKRAWERGQLWAMHDCLYRTRARGGAWALFLDVDEYIHTEESLLGLVARLRREQKQGATWGRKEYEGAMCRNTTAYKWHAAQPQLQPKCGARCSSWQGGRKYMVDAQAVSKLNIHSAQARSEELDAHRTWVMHCRGTSTDPKDKVTWRRRALRGSADA